MIINSNTKISALIKQNPDALEVVISISPKFVKLRNPLLRKVIAGRTSITMASKLGGCTVDLGLIYQLDFEKTEKKIFYTMTLTTQFCPMGESITNAAKEVIASTFPQWEAIIELTFNPAWNYKMISEEGQQFLNKG